MDWSYLAGFTDGDGCISTGVRVRDHGWRGRWYQVRWGQCEANAVVIDRIVDFLAAQGVSVKASLRPTRLGQRVSEIAVQRRDDVLGVLRQMEPFLVLKQSVAQDVIAVIERDIAGDAAIAADRQAALSAVVTPSLPRRVRDGEIPATELRELRLAGATIPGIAKSWKRSPATIKRWIDQTCPDVGASVIDRRRGRYA